MSNDKILRNLADREAIRDVRHRFGRALDTRDWPLFESLFTDDIEADFTQFGLPRIQGPKQQLTGFFRQAFGRDDMRTQQLYANFLIAIDGDRAHCISSLHGHHYVKDCPGGEVFELRATYHDHLVRDADSWKLAALRLQVISLLGNAAMLS